VPRPPRARGREGAASVQDQLAAQRPRPVAVRLYAALFGDAGPLGAPARRRLLGFMLRSLPAAVAVPGAALVTLRVFEGDLQGAPQLLALAALAAALIAVVWRRAWRATHGVGAGYREQLELGGLFVVAASALAQATGAGAVEPPLQPVTYLVMAFLVAFLVRPVGLAMVLLAMGLEAGTWWHRGADPATLAAPLTHAGFLALFALLYHGVLAAQLAATRRAERDAVTRRLRELDERAREFRLLAPRAESGGTPVEGGRRWIDGAVREVEAAVRGAVEVAAVALHADTCAVYLLSADDQRLLRRECRSASDTIAAEVPAGEGALGGAVRRASPVRLQGEVRAASYHLDGRRLGALLAVPLLDRRGGHVRGVLVADRFEDRPFSDEDERLLATLAAEVLRAVASERLMEDLKQTRDEKERFFEAIERLNRATTLDQVTEVSIEVARAMVDGIDFGAVTLVEADGGKPVHRVARAWSAAGRAPALEGLSFGDEAGSLVTSAVRLGASLPGKDLDVARAVVFDAGTRLKGLASIKVIPLKAQPLRAEDPPVLGTLVLGSRRPDAFGADRVRQLEVLALQAAETIQRARLFDATERMATTDGLTGLLNHRTFQVRLDEHLLTAQRYGRRLSLILCDIDHFKSVNDTYGHPVGDQVLRGVSRILAKEARTTDLVARYGGEEFAVVMPETDTAGGLVIAERIRARIAQLVTETAQGPLRVTMSLGLATSPEDGQMKSELIERADACLYHAKRHGRNQSVASATLRGPARTSA
jgi:two-component system cell cycle response regulator